MRALTWEVTYDPGAFWTDRWCGQAWDPDRAVSCTVRARTETKARRGLEREVARRRKQAAEVLGNKTRGVMPPASPLSVTQ